MNKLIYSLIAVFGLSLLVPATSEAFGKSGRGNRSGAQTADASGHRHFTQKGKGKHKKHKKHGKGHKGGGKHGHQGQ
jgi:hypothetical protein